MEIHKRHRKWHKFAVGPVRQRSDGHVGPVRRRFADIGESSGKSILGVFDPVMILGVVLDPRMGKFF